MTVIVSAVASAAAFSAVVIEFSILHRNTVCAFVKSLRANHDMALFIFTDRPACHTFDILNGCMDNASLIRAHRFKCDILLELDSLVRCLGSDCFQCLFALLSEILYIERHLKVTVTGVVRRETDKVLQRGKSVSPMTDHHTEIIIVAVNIEDRALVGHFLGYFKVLNPHIG